MNLKVFIPSSVVLERKNVMRIVAESKEGCFGILPQRLDCVACLVAGILIYETQEEGEKIIAIDEGILVKVGPEVQISVRNAVKIQELQTTHQEIVDHVLKLSEQEKKIRGLTEKLARNLLLKLQQLRKNR